MELNRNTAAVVRPAVVPDESDVRGARLGAAVGPLLQPPLDRPEVHRPLDDGGVVVESEASPVHRLPESFRGAGSQQGI